MRWLKLLAALTVAVTFAAARPLAQTPAAPSTESFTGHVLTGSGIDARPVRRAKVTLTRGPRGLTSVADTDSSGVYRFPKLPAGRYGLMIQKPGFITLQSEADSGATFTLARGGAIEGIVSDGTGDPLMNAAVTILKPQAGGSAQAIGQTRTNDLGEYRVSSLETGEYLVQAETDKSFILSQGLRPGQLPADPARAFFPAAATIETARPIHVEAGRDDSSIDVTLTPNPPKVDPAGAPPRPPEEAKGAGAISGRITDATSGKPIAGAHLLLLAADGLRITNWSATDAQGRYRYTGLAARKYTLQASAARFLTLEYGRRRPGEAGVPIDVAASETVIVDMALPRGSAIEGLIVDEFGDPAPGISVVPMHRAFVAGRERMGPVPGPLPPLPTDDRGHYRVWNLQPGEYYVAAMSGAFVGQDAVGGFAPTYYPGTPDSGAATPITLPVGADANAAFALTPAPTVKINGVMLDSSGRPVSGRGTIWLSFPDRLHKMDANVIRIATAPDGTFEMRNVPQGTYTLQGFAPPAPDYRGPMNLNAMPFGWLPLTVGQADLDGITLKVSEGVSVRGHILLEDGDRSVITPEMVQVATYPTNFDEAPAGGGPAPYEIRGDWTFEVQRQHGEGLVHVSVSSAAWALKRVTLNGQDVTDEPLDFRQGDVNGIEVVLSGKISNISGSVADDKGPVSEYAVLVFSADPAKWTTLSRFIAVGRPDAAGHFKIAKLPPDDYLAVALPRLEPPDSGDPRFLESLRLSATSITVTEGSSQTLALKLKPRP